MHKKLLTIISLIVIAVIGIPAILSLSNQQQKLRASAQTSPSTTYYVSPTGNDSNPGTEASPWKTIQKAASTIMPGDTAIVNAGNYAEHVSSARNGTASARITFRASGTVVIRTFNIGHSYITVDGFEITAGNMNTVKGSANQLLNNKIHDTGPNWGVVDISGSGHLIKGNSYSAATGPGDDKTVFIVAGTNHILENNDIGPAKDIDAFRPWGSGHIIRGNHIHDIVLSSGSSSHMDVIQTFGVNGGEAYNIIFEKNLITNFNGQMMMTENNNDPDFHDWDIRNNIYVNADMQMNIGIPNLRFYNNTFYNVGSLNNLVMYMYNSPGKGNYTGTQIKNNIFISSSGISSYGQVISGGSSFPNVQVSNNFISRINTWGTLSGFNDSTGVNGGNPEFVNAAAGDFNLLSGSPAINRGANLTGFNNDYANATRPQGSAWDIGAFEFGSTAPPSGITPPLSVSIIPPASPYIVTPTIYCLGSCLAPPASPTSPDRGGIDKSPTTIDTQNPDSERKTRNDNRGFIQIILELLNKILILLQLLLGLKS